MNPGNCLFSDSDKLGIRLDHPHRRIEIKFGMVGGLHDVVLKFEFHQNRSSSVGPVGGRNLPLLIGLYKIVISQQIKEVIANGRKKN